LLNGYGPDLTGHRSTDGVLLTLHTSQVVKWSKKPGMTKPEIARQMYPLIWAEGEKVIAQAFIEGAG
jgi:hypothetical protein